MKRYEFAISKAFFEKFFPKKRLKTKADIIEVLMESLKYMLINPTVTKDKKIANLVVHIDKMSRIFFFSKDKYYSIAFPFFVKFFEGKYSFSYKNQTEIDSQLISQVLSIIKCDEFRANCSLDFVEPICEYEEQCDENFWYFLRELLLMEDGYIRYDHDSENEDETVHPLHHFDMFYSSNATFKIGLNQMLEHDHFLDIMDVNTSCRYIR